MSTFGLFSAAEVMLYPAKFSFVAAVAALAFTSRITALGNGPEVGKPAPRLELGAILQAPADANLERLRGTVVIVDFWATWCGPCRKSIPHWNQLVDEFKGKPVQFVAVTDENEDIVKLFLKRTPIHSWVGLNGVGPSMRDRYSIEGIPTTVIINEAGVVVAVTHPAALEPKHIQEVIDTGKSSLPLPSDAVVSSGSSNVFESVPTTNSIFEVSVRRSGPLPPGHGVDCWAGSATGADVSGQYASVRQAILSMFDSRQLLLDCRTTLPTEQYDFTVRLPPEASHADREQAVTPMFRSVFGLQIRRMQAEREVYILKVASTNTPGLSLSGPNSSVLGSSLPDGCNLGRSTVDGLVPLLENWLRKPVINETGLTNRYDIRLKWKMSKRELLPYLFDPQVLSLVEKPDAAKEEELPQNQRRQLAGIRGKLDPAEFQRLSTEEHENIDVARAELAKPDDDRCLPEPGTVIAAVREQLGLGLSIERRSVPTLVVEKAQKEQ